MSNVTAKGLNLEAEWRRLSSSRGSDLAFSWRLEGRHESSGKVVVALRIGAGGRQENPEKME